MRGFITTIDIRASHVSAVVARVNSDGKLEILGKACRFLAAAGGGGVDRRLADAITNTFYDAADEAGVYLNEAYFCFTSEMSGIIEATARKDFKQTGPRVMEQTDANTIVSAGYKYPLPDTVSIIDVVPRKFKYADGESFVFPWGKKTSFIEASVGLQVVDNTVMERVRNVVAMTQIKPVGYSLSGMAAGYAVLSVDERQDGAIVINIGTHYTDVSVFFDGTPVFSATMPMGSDDCIRDLSSKLNVTYEAADALRRMYGLASVSLIEDDHMVPVTEDRDCMLSDIVRVIENRYSKIFEIADTLIAREEFNRSEPDQVVITGLGASSTEGLTTLCDSVMNKHSQNGRILASFGGRVENVGAVGLAEYIFENREYGKQTLFAEFVAREEKVQSDKQGILGIFKGRKRRS